MDIVKALSRLDKELRTTDYVKESIRLLSEFFSLPLAGFITRTTELPECFGNIPERQFRSLESVVLKTLPKGVLIINDTLPAPWGEIARIGYKSLLVLPVVINDNLAAAFVFPDKKRHDFTDKATYQLECACHQSSSSLEFVIKRSKSTTSQFIKVQKQTKAAIIICDRSGEVIEANEDLRDLFGVDKADIVGKKASQIRQLGNLTEILAKQESKFEAGSDGHSEPFVFSAEGQAPRTGVVWSDRFFAGESAAYIHGIQFDDDLLAPDSKKKPDADHVLQKILASIHRIVIEPLVYEGIDVVLSDLGTHLKAARLSMVKLVSQQSTASQEYQVTRQWVSDESIGLPDYNDNAFRPAISKVRNGVQVNGAFDGIADTGLASVIIAPLFFAGAFWGFFTIESKSETLSWTSEQVKHLSTLGEFIICMTNSHEQLSKLGNDIDNYKLFIKGSPTSVVVASLKTGNIIDVSNGFTILTGWSHDEVVGKNSLDIGVYEDAKVRADFFEQIRKSGRVIGQETRIITKSGMKKTILLSGEGIYANGERLIVTTAQDITQIKEAQEELKKSEELGRAIIQSLPEYIIVADLDGTIIDAKNGLNITEKLDCESLKGRKFTDFLPIEAAGRITGQLDSLKATGQSNSLDFEVEANNLKKYFTARLTATKNNQLIVVFQDITGFRTSEFLLGKTKDKFYTIFHASPQGIVIIDQEFFRAIDCNSKFSEIFGRDPSRLVGESIESFIDFDEHPQMRDLLMQIRKKETLSNYEISLSDMLGNNCLYLVNSTKVNIGGEETYVVQFADISELTKIKQELSESDDRFRTVVTNSTFPSIIHELESGRVLLCNSSLLKMLCLEGANISRQSISDLGLIPPESYKGYVDDLKVYGILKDQIQKCRLQGDAAIDVLLSSEIIRFNGKECVFTSFQDITPLKLANQTLLESEERYRLLVENSPLGTLFVENNGTVVSTNKAFLVMFGFEGQEEITGVNLIEHPLFASSGISEDIITCLECNETLISERHVAINDSDIYVVVYATPFHDSLGKVNRIQLIFEDITITKMVEFELKQAINQAQSASSAKSEFLANMSHEIRTPLNALLGFVQLLAQDMKDEKQKQYIGAIETAAQALNSMTSSLLDISKIEAGKIILEYSAQDISGLIRDSILLTEQKSLELENNLVFKFDNQPSVYMIDPDRFKQVMINLLGNAVKFTRNGVVTVSLGIAKGDGIKDLVTIDVDDTGIGIPPEMRDTVFEPFMQVDSSATRKYGGTGLGLAIVKGLVEKMNGNIRIVDKKGEGTLFRIVFELERVMSQKIRIAKSKDVFICLKDKTEIEIFKSVLERTSLNLHYSDSIPDNLKFIKLVVCDSQTSQEYRKHDSSVLPPFISVGEEYESPKWIGIPRPFEKASIISAISKLFPDEPELAFLNLVGRKILIVEDNQLNIMLLKDILDRMGCHITVSMSGLEAIELMKKGEFEAVLMDVQMPDLSGLDATMQMRYFEESSTRNRLPIIALTAYATKEDRERCINAGMDDFVAKPFKMSDLLTALSKAIYKMQLDSQKGVIEKLAERLLIDQDKLREFLGNFAATSIKSLESLESLINSGDFSQALKITHTIKGMAYVEDLHKSIVKLESTLRKQDKAASFQDLVELRNNLLKLQQDISKT